MQDPTTGNVSLQFVGKKGVNLNIPVTDPDVSQMLVNRAQASGPNGQLFPNTSERALRAYSKSLGEGTIKTKDFRTLLGTRIAKEMVANMPTPVGEKSLASAMKMVATAVSKKLGNTPDVALNSYINPEVFSGWIKQQ